MKKDEIEIGNKLVKFNYDIKETIDNGNKVFILLEIPYSDNELNNIYCYNKNGLEVWRVNTEFDRYNINNRLPYEMMRIIEGKLYASDFYGRRFQIDFITGESILYDVVKY